MYQIYPKSKFFQRIEPFYWSYHLLDTISNKIESFNFFPSASSLPRTTQFRFDGILGTEVFAGGSFEGTGFGFRARFHSLQTVLR